MVNETTSGPELRLPSQAAPVDRRPGATALSDSGAEASGWLDDIVGVATTVGPPLLKAFGI